MTIEPHDPFPSDEEDVRSPETTDAQIDAILARLHRRERRLGHRVLRLVARVRYGVADAGYACVCAARSLLASRPHLRRRLETGRPAFGVGGMALLVVISFTAGSAAGGGNSTLDVAPPQPQPDLPRVEVASAVGRGAGPVQSGQAPPQVQPAAQAPPVQPSSPAPVGPPVEAAEVQPATPTHQVQSAAPAAQVQPAAPAQQLQPAAPAQQLQPAAPAPQVQPATPPPAGQPPVGDGYEQPQVAVAPPPPQPNLQVAPPQPTPEIQVAQPQPTPEIQLSPREPVGGVVQPLAGRWLWSGSHGAVIHGYPRCPSRPVARWYARDLEAGRYRVWAHASGSLRSQGEAGRARYSVTADDRARAGIPDVVRSVDPARARHRWVRIGDVSASRSIEILLSAGFSKPSKHCSRSEAHYLIADTVRLVQLGL